ncbi:MAG: Txe/YoeB family addiction module toxin [Flavobacteriales bacterium]|nr:Txe/YoeB family addiction module toxin [Flavobacteriales bacterium]MCB9364773.1 Txe/YoeB family addiction module toxin [Flavobacteriales bacterium]
MEIEFTKTALKDLKYWKNTKNTTIQKRISVLLEDIVKHPFSGIGKPEALKYQLKGFWSRRITKEHRIIYKVVNNKIIIVTALRFHY